jgi:hypothetical protein
VAEVPARHIPPSFPLHYFPLKKAKDLGWYLTSPKGHELRGLLRVKAGGGGGGGGWTGLGGRPPPPPPGVSWTWLWPLPQGWEVFGPRLPVGSHSTGVNWLRFIDKSKEDKPGRHTGSALME